MGRDGFYCKRRGKKAKVCKKGGAESLIPKLPKPLDGGKGRVGRRGKIWGAQGHPYGLPGGGGRGYRTGTEKAKQRGAGKAEKATVSTECSELLTDGHEGGESR